MNGELFLSVSLIVPFLFFLLNKYKAKKAWLLGFNFLAALRVGGSN